MNDSVTAISVLEFTLKKYCQTIFKHLQPGLTEEQMNSLLTDTTFNFSELKKIYSWRNGTSADFLPELSRRSFHACGNFMPLKVAVSMKEKLDSLKMWDSGLFPFLSNGDRDYLLIDLKESSCTYGMLFILSQTKLVIPLEPAYDSFLQFRKYVTSSLWYYSISIQKEEGGVTNQLSG